MAVKDDINQLKVLYRELEADAVRFQPEHFLLSIRSEDFFTNIFNSDNQDIIVAEMDESVIGFSHVMVFYQKNISCLKPESLVYIQDMDVAEKYRNQGIGTLLLEKSKEYGKQRGVDFIRTQVFPQNVDGIRFYEKIGFKEKMKTMECLL